MRKEYHLELNGYSNFFVEPAYMRNITDFTMTFVFVPYTYESCVSGILSNFSVKEKQGVVVGVGKRGIVTVKLGVDGQVLEISSLKEHAAFQESNTVTVAFWGTAGWCDLYVNGKLSNRKQFKRRSEMAFPYCESYIGKYVDGEMFCHDTRRGVFHGRLDSIAFVDASGLLARTMAFVCLHLSRGETVCAHYISRDGSLDNWDYVEEDTFGPDGVIYHPSDWRDPRIVYREELGEFWMFLAARVMGNHSQTGCVGLCVSKDLKRWEYRPPIYYPERFNGACECLDVFQIGCL